MKSISLCTIICIVLSCTHKEVKTIGIIERLDPAVGRIIGDEAIVEVIADGFSWSGGPLWIEDQQTLIFSDVPENTIYK